MAHYRVVSQRETSEILTGGRIESGMTVTIETRPSRAVSSMFFPFDEYHEDIVGPALEDLAERAEKIARLGGDE